MKAILTVGVSGSGKSSWAENLRMTDGDNSTWQIINRDSTRWGLSGKEGWNGPNAYRFHSAIEDAVTEYNSQRMYDAAIECKDIIISDTNLNPKTRNKLIKQCQDLGYEVEIKEFPIGFQQAVERDKQRGIFAVGEVVLMKQWESWVKYWEDKQQGAW